MVLYNLYIESRKNRIVGEEYDVEIKSLTEARKRAMKFLYSDHDLANVHGMAIAKVKWSDWDGYHKDWVGTVRIVHSAGQTYFMWEDEKGKVTGIKKDGSLALSQKTNTKPYRR